MSAKRPPFLVRGDLDGFFGLFIDNLLHLLIIVALCPVVCGLPLELVTHTILPGAAISILIGNLFYAAQALFLGAKEKRGDATAMPYGINTFSLMAFITLIMGPVYRQTGDGDLAWKMGLVACVLSGVIEVVGAPFAGWVRRKTPRAALLSSLAGIALTLISMKFFLQIFSVPLLAIVPLFFIVAFYAGRVKLPLGIPAGLLAVLVGGGIAALLKTWMPDLWMTAKPDTELGFRPPIPVAMDLWDYIRSLEGIAYLSVILPMALLNIVNSLQCLESAEAGGDRYGTWTSLTVNGIGSILAACFGSPFPTTLHIGHPGWKSLGARWAYSALSGAAIAGACLFGVVPLVLYYVPLEVTLGILIWIALALTAQAFRSVPKRHGIAVAIGIVPAIAAWGVRLVEGSLKAAGTDLATTISKFDSDLHIGGLLALGQGGFLITCILFAAVTACALDRRFVAAGVWMMLGALLSLTGLIHGYELGEGGLQSKLGWLVAWEYAVAYGVLGLIFWIVAPMAMPGEPVVLEKVAEPRDSEPPIPLNAPEVSSGVDESANWADQARVPSSPPTVMEELVESDQHLAAEIAEEEFPWNQEIVFPEENDPRDDRLPWES